MAEDENKSFWRKLFGLVWRNPINSACIVTILYCALQAFVLGNSPAVHKSVIAVVVGIWLFLFVAEHLFKLVLLIIAAGIVFFAYLYWTGSDKRLCEENGGHWNAKIEKCEEKQPWWHKLTDFFKQ